MILSCIIQIPGPLYPLYQPLLSFSIAVTFGCSLQLLLLLFQCLLVSLVPWSVFHFPFPAFCVKQRLTKRVFADQGNDGRSWVTEEQNWDGGKNTPK